MIERGVAWRGVAWRGVALNLTPGLFYFASNRIRFILYAMFDIVN